MFSSKNKKNLLPLLIFAIIQSVKSDCAFTFKCTDPKNLKTCKPYQADNVTSIPVKRDKEYYNNTFICPSHYLDTPNCCNFQQNNQMIDNFQKVDASFGALGGGCDYCASNMKQFWCDYTCNPYQSEKVIVGDEDIDVPDPLSPDGKVKAQNVTVYVGADSACALFSACKLTPYVTQVTAMSTPAGFLAFQGSNAVISAFQFMTIQFRFNTTATNSINITDYHKCNENIDEVTQPDPNNPNIRIDTDGFQIRQNCSCNTCAESCPVYDYTPPGYMEGFDYKIIIWVYVSVVVLSIAAVLIRIQKQKQQSASFIDNNDSNIDKVE